MTQRFTPKKKCMRMNTPTIKACASSVIIDKDIGKFDKSGMICTLPSKNHTYIYHIY